MIEEQPGVKSEGSGSFAPARTRDAGPKLAAVLRHLTSAVMAVNTESQVAYVNPAAEALLQDVFGRQVRLGIDVWEQFPELRGTLIEQKCREALRVRKTDRFDVSVKEASRVFQVQVIPCEVGLIATIEEVTKQRRTVRELQESRSQLEAALYAAAISTWSWDARENIVRADARVATLFSLEPSRAAAGLPLGEFLASVHPDDRGPLKEALFRAVETGGRFEREYRVVRADGVMRWVLARAGSVSDQMDRAMISGVLVDINEKKAAETARLHFRALFESAPGLYLVLEPREPFRIAGASDAFLRATMTQRENIIGHPVFDIFPDAPGEIGSDGVRNLRASLARVLEHRRTDVMRLQRYPIRRLKGSEVEFEERFWSPVNAPVFGSGGEVEYIIHRVEDVTSYVHAKQAQHQFAAVVDELESRDQHLEADVFLRAQETHRVVEELRAREEELRIIIDHIRDFALYSTDLDGKITRWNPGAEAVFGWTAEEILGQRSDVLFTPDDRERGVPGQERAAALAGGFASEDRWYVRKSGERFFATGAVRAMLDSAGELRGFLKVSRDITHAKRQQEELEAIVEQRTASLRDTVQQLETFSYSVVHDMRAPLRAMASYSNILQADYGDRLGEEGRHYVARINSAARRMDALITDVLSYSRISSAEVGIGRVDMDRLVRDIMEGYPQFQECRGCISVESTLPVVKGNTALLTQCVSNLLGNGIKFVAEGRTPHVRVFGEAGEGRARIWFVDNGIGILSEFHDKIFGLFQRLHRTDEYPGTGVGLAIVAKAMERMNGKVGVESTPGEGSRFWIELPTP